MILTKEFFVARRDIIKTNLPGFQCLVYRRGGYTLHRSQYYFVYSHMETSSRQTRATEPASPSPWLFRLLHFLCRLIWSFALQTKPQHWDLRSWPILSLSASAKIKFPQREKGRMVGDLPFTVPSPGSSDPHLCPCETPATCHPKSS
jgi:hypothetical protein